MNWALLLTALAFVACTKPDNPDGSETVAIDREIVYTVNQHESHRTLTTEAEWDAMLESFCEQAMNGGEVTFFNMNQLTYAYGTGKSAPKESSTISTADRNEIKRWMKAMEKEGRTVIVTYDYNTGTWNGTAYATAPADNTAASIIGTWHFNSMVVTTYDLNGMLTGSDLYAPEEDGGTMYYTFATDGTVTLTFESLDGNTASDSSTWTLSDDGVLTSDLLPSGIYWNVNWITASTLIISSSSLGTEEGDMYYQLQFDRQ